MSRAKLQALLDATLAQIEAAEARAADQRALIEKLRAGGRPTGQAETLLTLFETLVAVHVAERDRLQALLHGID